MRRYEWKVNTFCDICRYFPSWKQSLKCILRCNCIITKVFIFFCFWAKLSLFGQNLTKSLGTQANIFLKNWTPLSSLTYEPVRSYILLIFFISLYLLFLKFRDFGYLLMICFCTIWYHLHYSKNVKNTHGRQLLLVKLQASVMLHIQKIFAQRFHIRIFKQSVT